MATRTSLAEAAPGSAARGARATGIAEALQSHGNLKNAQREDPLLGSPVGAARRGAVLERLGEELERRGGEERAHAIELTRSMRPNSVAEAWDGLYAELLRLGEEDMAEAAANEARGARAEAWGSMRGDADIISQVVPMGEQFASSHASCVNRYRQKVAAMAACSRPFRLGREMEDHVVDMARFGSLADDWMTRVVIDELYLERGLYEEVCGICERILEFGGNDRRRMAASTLVEDVLGALLVHLERCRDGRHVDDMVGRGMPISPECRRGEYLDGLNGRCLEMLQERARSLELNIVPSPWENSLARRAMEYALKVRERRTVLGAGELSEYVRGAYPESYAFLRLGDHGVAERMEETHAPLAEDISVQVEMERTARSRNARRAAGGALGLLEPMLRLMRNGGGKIKPATLKRWRSEMRGAHLDGCLFEMGVYFRLVMADMEVETDAGVPGAAGGAVADMRADGCLVEAYSPLGRKALKHSRAARIGDPGVAMVDRVLQKSQFSRAGDSSIVAVVNCPGGEFGSIAEHREAMGSRLAASPHPGAIFLVRAGDGPREVECLVNRNAATAVPVETLQKIRGALELEAL